VSTQAYRSAVGSQEISIGPGTPVLFEGACEIDHAFHHRSKQFLDMAGGADFYLTMAGMLKK